MPNHMEMICDDACSWQDEAHRFTEGHAHIHTHRLDCLGVAETFQQAYHGLASALGCHLQDRAMVQITQDRVVAMAFATCKFVNAKTSVAWLRALSHPGFAHLQPTVAARTRAHSLATSARADSHFGGDMGNWTQTALQTHRLAPALGAPASIATRSIGFRKTASARQAKEAPFIEQQPHGITSQWQISLAADARIMHF